MSISIINNNNRNREDAGGQHYCIYTYEFDPFEFKRRERISLPFWSAGF